MESPETRDAARGGSVAKWINSSIWSKEDLSSNPASDTVWARVNLNVFICKVGMRVNQAHKFVVRTNEKKETF